MSIDTPVFYHESFTKLIIILVRLNIVDIKHRVVAPTLAINKNMNPSWIPIQSMGLYAEFIEIISHKTPSDNDNTKQ